jgi:hypothetical protein
MVTTPKKPQYDFGPLLEHHPRPAGDPDYVPWWAKGEYAARLVTKYATESGVIVEAGFVTGRVPRHARVESVPEPRAAAPSATETPRKAPRVPREPDAAQRAVAECNGKSERVALCKKHGIDPAILDAPNAGVATMRLLNALRKAMR